MRIIAIANQKGGCGKTTTAINIASSLSQKGQRVLLIDCDPQSHATMGLNIDADLKKTLYNVLTIRQSEQLPLDDVVVKIKDNFDLAPANMMLNAVEQEFADVAGREERLLQAIRSNSKPYDFIILDCPPSIGHLCFNALRACDEVIIPIDMSLFSLRGVAKLLDLVITLKDACCHVIKTRALITMFDYRTRYARRVLEKVKEQFGDNVFETVIRYNIRLRETVDYGLPVGDYDKHAIGHQDYEKLAEEIKASKNTYAYQSNTTTTAAQEILQRTEEYISNISATPPAAEPEPETDDCFPQPLQSSYKDMVNTLAVQPFASHPEDED